MVKRSSCIAGLLLAAFLSRVPAADERRVTGREAEAIAVADFKSKQGSKIDGRPVYGDLRHYSLVLERQGNRLHIVFMPEDVPLKSNEAATGGSTKYGWAVDYYISLTTTARSFSLRRIEMICPEFGLTT
jgi:hypothetical protein